MQSIAGLPHLQWDTRSYWISLYRFPGSCAVLYLLRAHFGTIVCASQVFLPGKMQGFLSNQSNCSMVQYASQIIYFYENGWLASLALSKINATFCTTSLSGATIYRWYNKFEDGIIDAPIKAWQIHICGSKLLLNLAQFLNCSTNTVLSLTRKQFYK